MIQVNIFPNDCIIWNWSPWFLGSISYLYFARYFISISPIFLMVELCIRLSDPQWVGSLIDFNGVYHCLFVRQVQVKQKCISMSGWKVHWQVPSKYKIFGQFLFFILTNDSSCRFLSISCPVWGLRVSSNIYLEKTIYWIPVNHVKNPEGRKHLGSNWKLELL